ncbi:hypothetical protein PT974_00252 [Cladobotryum mycophilum]|uniref:Uncharacterized protein n=1 Tax=Cladobotryum mycophilum TaxID=491253 RepID=A0ABR0T0A1_9HYPO
MTTPLAAHTQTSPMKNAEPLAPSPHAQQAKPLSAGMPDAVPARSPDGIASFVLAPVARAVSQGRVPDARLLVLAAVRGTVV